MRLHVKLELEEPAAIRVDHQHELQGVVYSLLHRAAPDLASFIHQHGYPVEREGDKRLKLFVFSGLRAQRSLRRVEGACLHLEPGNVDWFISSPIEPIVAAAATGLLSAGRCVKVGTASFRVRSAAIIATPALHGTTPFTCLSPIVAAVRRQDGGTQYLTAADGPSFEQAIRANLLRKYQLLTGHPPRDDAFSIQFDQAYLAHTGSSGGTRLVNFKGIQVRGAFAPFTASADPELLAVGWAAGFGQNNSAGFGMVDIARQQPARNPAVLAACAEPPVHRSGEPR